MKTVIAMIALTAGIIIGAGWSRGSRFIMYMHPPATPAEWAPRYRHWQNGVEVFG